MPIRTLAGAAALTLLALAPVAADTRTGTAGRDVLTGRGGADVLYGDPVAGMGTPRKVQRVSVTKDGGEGMGESSSPSVTADGHTMLFLSDAPQFLPAGVTPNGWSQVYRKNLVTGAVTLESVGNGGTLFEGITFDAAVSPDGRYAAIVSNATNIPDVPLQAGGACQAGGEWQIVLKDLATETYTLVSRSPGGSGGSGDSFNPVFSPNGAMLAFISPANNLVAGASSSNDVYIVRLSNPDKVYLASTTAAGDNAMGGDSEYPVFSPDGKTLAFTSYATNLLDTPDMNDAFQDVFLKSLDTFADSGRILGSVRLANTNASGVQNTSGYSDAPTFSPDGRDIAFVSTADSLVSSDLNGGGRDIFIKTIKPGGPREVGAIRLVSRSETGAQSARGGFNGLTFSPDGTRLAFGSNDASLAGEDDNGHLQILLKDIATGDDNGPVTMVSRSTAAAVGGGNDASWEPVFVGHGDRLLFYSDATDLVAKDTNSFGDIFLATLAAPTGGNDTLSGGPGKDVLVGGP